MKEANATILIPDISGFTEFMTTTEHNHSLRAISMLINTIVDAVGEEYEISEIEGDAVLMFKKGPAPSLKEIQDSCLKIFNAFHFQRKWIQQHAICLCKACQGIINLTLKFVVHHGVVGEMKVGRFITLSGTDVIVAHRLLKNNIPSNEYLLMTEKLLQQSTDNAEVVDMHWTPSSEEYAAIGKVDYRFALLHEMRKKVPEPPALKNDYPTDATAYLEVPIAAHFKDVYMIVMNIPGRSLWIPGLKKVEQEVANVFVGSIHYCSFDQYQAIVSPLRMILTEEEILYAERCQIQELQLSLVYEFVFRNINKNACVFGCRFINTGDTPISSALYAALLERLQIMAKSLKEYIEKGVIENNIDTDSI